MLPAFGKAVLANRVILHARIKSLLSPLQRVPKDIWPHLAVTNWSTAVADDPNGTRFYSIHVEQVRQFVPVIASREHAAILALASHLRTNPQITRAEAMAYCADAGFKVGKRAFQIRVWPSARKKAGLDEQAVAGRKPKSSHSIVTAIFS